MEFKERLKKARQEKQLSQQALADAIFVSRSAVAKWENGLGLPGESSYQALLDFFEFTQEEFPLNQEVEAVYIVKNRKIRKLSMAVVLLSCLLVVGILLLCLSVILSVVSTAGKDIIGGADLPTFLFVFRHENGGMYFALALLGVISLTASLFFFILGKKN